MKINLSYPAKIKFDGEVYHVSFPDVENCFTYGETLEDALENAQDVLGAMLKSWVKGGEVLPQASPLKKGMRLIAPFPEIAAPLELFLLRKKQGKTIADVAKLLNITKQRYAEIENGKNLTMKTFHNVSSALGATAHVGLA